MAHIEIINLSLTNYCEFLENSDYHFRTNATSRMYIKDNKIWKFDDWGFFSTESPVIDYREELNKLNVNVLKELIYLEGNYLGYTISPINGFDLSEDLFDTNIMFSFDTHQFNFIDFDFWKHYKLDPKDNIKDSMMLEKIKQANETCFDQAMTKILEKTI